MPRPIRLNVGCGYYPKAYWVNIDEDENIPADAHRHIPPLLYEDGSVTEIYAGHFLEHLEKEEADQFLQESYRALRPRGRIGIVVPDMYEMMRRYVLKEPAPVEINGTTYDMRDLDVACGFAIFSVIQESRHLWAYDRNTLARSLTRAGFQDICDMDPYDKRIPRWAWYQFGLDAIKG